MTYYIKRTIAGAIVGVSAMGMLAHGQTVTNPLQNAAPANERGGVRGNTNDAAATPRRDAKQNERDAKDAASNQASGNQPAKNQGSPNSQKSNSGAQQNSSSQNSSANQSSNQRDAKNQGNTGSQSSTNARNDRDRTGRESSSRDSSSGDRNRSGAREHTSMKATDMRGPDIGLWFSRGNRDSLVISDVSTRGPIARLGFHEGDRIVSVNGHRIVAEAEFINYLLNSNADRVEVVVSRDGRDETIYVEPALLTQDYGYSQVDPIEQFGVVLDDRYDDRIVIWRVIPRSPAYYAGIREGDVISTLSGRPYTTRRDFEASVGDLKAGETNLQVRRGDRNRDLTVDVPEYERGAKNEERGSRSEERGMKGGEEQGVRDQGGQSANRDRSGASQSGNDSQNDRNGTDRNNNDRSSNDRNSGPSSGNQGSPNGSNQSGTNGTNNRGERR